MKLTCHPGDGGESKAQPNSSSSKTKKETSNIISELSLQQHESLCLIQVVWSLRNLPLIHVASRETQEGPKWRWGRFVFFLGLAWLSQAGWLLTHPLVVRSASVNQVFITSSVVDDVNSAVNKIDNHGAPCKAEWDAQWGWRGNCLEERWSRAGDRMSRGVRTKKGRRKGKAMVATAEMGLSTGRKGRLKAPGNALIECTTLVQGLWLHLQEWPGSPTPNLGKGDKALFKLTVGLRFLPEIPSKSHLSWFSAFLNL